MLFLLPALLGVLAVSAAYQLGRGMTHSLSVRKGIARMPEGAAHEIA
jgi:hypothetical protein